MLGMLYRVLYGPAGAGGEPRTGLPEPCVPDLECGFDPLLTGQSAKRLLDGDLSSCRGFVSTYESGTIL